MNAGESLHRTRLACKLSSTALAGEAKLNHSPNTKIRANNRRMKMFPFVTKEKAKFTKQVVLYALVRTRLEAIILLRAIESKVKANQSLSYLI